VFSNIYFVCKNNLQSAIDEGYEAVAEAEKQKEIAFSLQNRVVKNRSDYQMLLASMDYQINLFQTLALYRHYFLKYYQWLDTGEKSAYVEWNKVLIEFETQYQLHIAKHGYNLDFPAYNFDEALVSIEVAKRTKKFSLLALALSFLIFIAIFLGIRPFQKKNKFFPMKALSSLLWNALVKPTTAYTKREGMCIPVVGFVWLEILIMGSLFVFSSGIAGSFFWLFQGSLILYIFSIFVLNLSSFKTKSIEYLAVLSPVLVILLGLMSISAIRGPMYFWNTFWISDIFRVIFLTAFVAIIMWTYFVLYHRQKVLGSNNGLKAFANVLIIQAVQFLYLGVLSKFNGLEKSLTVLNDELIVLPGGLSRILGITTHLGIPAGIPDYLLIGSGLFLFVGILFLLMNALLSKKTV